MSAGGTRSIQKIVVPPSSTASSFIFSNIPQNYESLLIKLSTRMNANPESANWSSYAIRINDNTGAVYSQTSVYSIAGSRSGERQTNSTVGLAGWSNSSASNANGFSSSDIYFPNYNKNTLKTTNIKGTISNQSTTVIVYLSSGLIAITDPITKIEIFRATASFVAGSSCTLYGFF